MTEVTDPGVTAPPAEPAAPAATEPQAPAQPNDPTGSEPVTNPGDKSEQTVPFARFQEVNDKAKEAEERATKLQEELDQRPQTPSITPQNGEEELDPEVVDLVSKSAKKLGFVTQEELAQRETDIQVRQDVRELETTPPNVGIPYDHKEVLKYANDNNLPITSKAALRAAYRELNYDKIVEAERQKAIEGYKTAGSSGAEQPGSTGATPPSEPELTGKTAKERTRERIRNARQKLSV